MNEITKELLDALKMATLQNQLDMLMTGEELRKCESAIAKAKAALAATQSDDGWIPWAGGECPINNGVWFWLRFRNGHQFGPDNEATLWRWDNNHLNEGDIIAYRIAKESNK